MEIWILSQYLDSVMEEERDIVQNDIEKRKERMMSSASTKIMSYCNTNPPDLSVHPVYYSDAIVDDDFRIAFTRMRLISHRLRIETGRWARIPRERRLCQCGEAVQSEQHVLCECTLVEHIRVEYNNTEIDYNNFMTSAKSKQQLAMVMRILNFYGDI